MVDRSVTDSAAIDMAEREQQLLYDKSVSKSSNYTIIQPAFAQWMF